jgi:hypothetical protein
MDVKHCDPLMGADFRGIERFYPSAVALASHQAGEMIIGIVKGKPYSVSQAQLKSGKAALLRRVRAISDPKQLPPLVAVLAEIDQMTRGAALQLALPGVEEGERSG